MVDEEGRIEIFKIIKTVNKTVKKPKNKKSHVKKIHMLLPLNLLADLQVPTSPHTQAPTATIRKSSTRWLGTNSFKAKFCPI